MSLQAAANLLQQQGRGDDKMLVHMTPREVAGLEAIARAKGGQLTINPETGLPEAGFLDDVLPIAASAALMYFGGPIGASIGEGLGLSGALAQGVGMGLLTGGATTLLTGDVNKGLKTGLMSGALSGAMAGMNAPSTAEAPTANVQTTTPALAAEASSPNAFAYNASGEMVPANYPSQVTGATNMPAAPAPTSEKSWWGGLSGNQKLATGLAGAAGLSLLGSQTQDGVAVSGDKGTIRPYEYKTAMREPAAGKSQFFQPIEYDIAGRPTKPYSTSERTYFNQGYTALPTYKAANGGEVPPNLNRMPAGGLAAIEGMRDGYGAEQTVDGNIPQFAEGGQMPSNRMLEMMQEAKFDRDMPDQLRDFTRAKRMGLLEGMMAGDEQAKKMGYKPQDFMFAPQVSQDGRSMSALASLNKELTDDTEMKLMALGYKNPEKSGIARYGAGVTHKLDKDSDISGYFEQSPGGLDKSYGAKYTRRFGLGGTASATATAPESSGSRFTFDPATQQYTQTASPLQALQQAGGNIGMGLISRLMEQGGLDAIRPAPRYEFDPKLQAYKALAEGGHLGDYSDGGRLLKGPGDGVSDSIPASINDKQPARLADGEFVIPARIVSELGNGSTDAGAKRLYDMMDRIQEGRKKTVGKGKVAVDSKAKKHLPA